MRPKYPYYRLLGLTLLAALFLSLIVARMGWPNWYIHPLALLIGVSLYIPVHVSARKMTSDGEGELSWKPDIFYVDNRSSWGLAIYYVRLIAISFMLASPFEFIASLFRE